jgi:hypothetical protein
MHVRISSLRQKPRFPCLSSIIYIKPARSKETYFAHEREAEWLALHVIRYPQQAVDGSSGKIVIRHEMAGVNWRSQEETSFVSDSQRGEKSV